jgi:uncharacterized protein YegP (UPF0339 family)
METSVDWVEVFTGEDGQFYYRAKANNGETLNTSEGYTRKADALDAAVAVYGMDAAYKDKTNERQS